MDTLNERRKAVARILWQARHDRALELKQDISKRDQAVYLGLSEKTYGKWEDGASLPRPDTWAFLVETFGTEMAMALGMSENFPVELLHDKRFARIAAWWVDPSTSDRDREILIAISEKTVGKNPEMKRFLTELLATA